MSNSVQRDQQRRLLFAKVEKKRVQYQSVIRNMFLPIKHRRESGSYLNKLQRKSSLGRVRRRCVLSGRGRGVYQFARVSRIKLRELAGQGLVNGFSKVSW